MPSLLIVGDSFAAPGDYRDHDAWYAKLGRQRRVVNRARAGVGQYKIRKQIQSMDRFDAVILLITSEYRIHCLQNPFYKDPRHPHHHCDLILQDVESRLPSRTAIDIVWWFREIFDPDQARYQHDLTLRETAQTVARHCDRVIPITFFEPYAGMYDFGGGLRDLSAIVQQHPGDRNHLDQQGHDRVWQILETELA